MRRRSRTTCGTSTLKTSASSLCRAAFAAAAIASLLPATSKAQAPRPARLELSGRLVLVRVTDSTAVRGATVVAHRVGQHRQGAVDSMVTDGAGRFRFVIARPESAVVYVVSTSHAGIGYFSDPFTIEAREGADRITLAVFDTATSGEPMRVAVRHVVVREPEADGSRMVMDIFQIMNDGHVTRVGRDSLSAVWSAELPAAARNLGSGEGEVAHTAVRFEGSRVIVGAPIPPGLKQVVVTYTLDRRERDLRIPIDQATDRLEVFVAGQGASAREGLTVSEPLVLESGTFARFSANGLSAGATPRVTFGRTGGSSRALQWLAIGLAAAGLAGGGVLALRRRGGDGGEPAAAQIPRSREALLAQIVALDERFSGGESEVGQEAWASYMRRRAELKSQLAERVAQG